MTSMHVLGNLYLYVCLVTSHLNKTVLWYIVLVVEIFYKIIEVALVVYFLQELYHSPKNDSLQPYNSEHIIYIAKPC